MLDTRLHIPNQKAFYERLADNQTDQLFDDDLDMLSERESHRDLELDQMLNDMSL